MKKPTLLMVIALVALTAISVYYSASASRIEERLRTAQSENRRLESELKAVEIRSAGSGNTLAPDETPPEVLRSRIAELEKQLDVALGQAEALRDQLAAAPDVEEAPVPMADSGDQNRERSREEWRARRQEEMERLQREDPAEYARIRQEREAFRTRAVQHVDGQMDFFNSLNTEGLPQEYVNNHAALVEKLSEFQQLMNRINTDPASTQDDGVSRRELWESMREIGPMLDMERQVVLSDLANQLGYNQQEARDFIEYLDYIDEMTSPRGIMRNFGGGGPRGGGPRGGR